MIDDFLDGHLSISDSGADNLKFFQSKQIFSKKIRNNRLTLHAASIVLHNAPLDGSHKNA